MNETEAKKEELKRRLADYLTRTGRPLNVNFKCPNHAAHKNNDSTPSAHFYPESNTVYCFAEDRSFDIFDLIGFDENISDFPGQMARAAEILEGTSRREPPRKAPTKTAETDFSGQYAKYCAELKESPEALAYLERRGITPESAEHFNIGYCEDWNHPSTPGKKSKRLIIPRNKNAYLARSIESDVKPQKQVVGKQKTLFNEDVIKNDSPMPVIVAEGEINAISLYQLGYPYVCGIGATGNKDIAVKVIKEKAPKAVYILALDNDEAGRTAQQYIYDELTAAGITAINADTDFFFSGEDDPNDAYIKDPDSLVSALAYYIEEAGALAGEEKAERNTRTGAAMINAFIQKAKTEAYQPIKTGISEVDNMLGGGFMKQSITILQAAPGTGKTALASQLFEGMAKNGHEVIFINLEMSKEQLIARSLARYTRRYTDTPLTPLEILQGYKWTPAQEEAVQTAGQMYAAEVAENLTYNPEAANRNIDSIVKTLEEEATARKAEGKAAPIVCVDYLQLIRGGDREDVTEATKRAIIELKNYAIKHDTFVFLISATNRASNISGANELTSGRDTSDIEYSADVLLGLTYKAIAEGRKSLADINKEKREALEAGEPLPEDARRLALTVLKGRLIGDGRRATFDFNGAYSEFIPVTNEPRYRMAKPI